MWGELMIEAAKFWNKAARKYAASKIGDPEAYAHKLAQTAQYYSADSALLEFGCGTGSTALHHAPHVASITAIDISPEMIAIAKEKQAAAGITNIDFRVGDLDAIPRELGQYDMVMAHSILHLIEDPKGAIARFHQVLKPGGYLVSSTACLKSGGALFSLLVPVMQFLGLAPYVNLFTKDTLKTWHEEAGFELSYVWHSDKAKMVRFLIAKKL